MHLEFTPAMLLPAAAIPIAAAIGMHTWRLRKLPGVTPFIFIAGIAAAWALFNMMELAATDLQDKLLWGDLQYIGMVTIPVAWLILALDYSGRHRWLAVSRILPFLVIPAISLVLLATNDYHSLLRTGAWLADDGPLPAAVRELGIWIWVQATYSYLIALAAMIILVVHSMRVSRRHRAQPLVLVGGFAVSIVYNAVYVLAPGALPLHDFTSAAFAVTGVILAWGLLRFQLFGLVPVARHAVVENMEDGLVVLDRANRVVDLNEAARRLIGTDSEHIMGRPLEDRWTAWQQVTGPCATGSGETTLCLGDGETRREYEVKVSDLVGRHRSLGRLLHVHDVTERSLMEDSLRRQALTDSLTGLPNRTLFMAKIDDAVRQARRSQTTTFAVIVLDLDRFKLVNDSIGHLAGDFLLEQVAAKLKTCVRDVDVIARMGGDEFMVLLHGVSTALDVLPVVERVQAELRVPVHYDQHEIASSASVGVALWEETYEGSEEILRAADTAMYQAKESGGSCYRIFDEAMHEAVLRTLQAEIELRAAVNHEDFSLDYQPILDIATGRVCSLEALVRWRHAEHGTIMPGEFIKIAEDSGLIVPLGALALEKVCNQISLWRSPGCRASALPISINVSPRQLVEDDFVATMLACLHEWRVDPSAIILEVTETALIRDPDRSKKAMLGLREAGFSLCLDDFGTGWSSLRHLTTFPVQHLKIDRSFVSKLEEENTEYQIVKALVGLAHSIGLEVTGEGVERVAQIRSLESLECDHAQGYYIGRPMSPDRLLDHLHELSRGALDPAAASPETARIHPEIAPEGVPAPPSPEPTARPRVPGKPRTGTGFAPEGLA